MSGETNVTHFEDLIKSDLFTFRIGEEGTTFVVHSQAIAGTSDPFKVLVNGSLAEATKRSAVLPNIRSDDFVRFIEYAYRRDYTIPSWTPDDTPVLSEDEIPPQSIPPQPEEPSIEVPAPAEEDTAAQPEPTIDWEHSRPTSSTKRKKKKILDSNTILRAKFRSLDYAVKGLPNAELIKHSTPKQNVEQDQDFTNILLAHARMYTIADAYLVVPLKALALHKLHQTLCEFQMFPRRVKDIVELCRYAYQNGHDRAENGSLDRLRALVVEYIVIEVSSISHHELFLKLMEEGGEFVRDFWVKAARNV